MMPPLPVNRGQRALRGQRCLSLIHIFIDAPDQIDAQLLAWLQAAHAFALVKGVKRA